MSMTFQDRLVGVFKLDNATFESVEHDPAAMQQAVMIVGGTAVLAGIGTSFGGGGFFVPLLAALASSFAGWVIWAVITFLVGTRLFDGTADVGEMLRVIGFAFAPQALAIIPCLGWLMGWIWTMAAGFVAVRQGLDLDNTKTAITIGLGALAYIALAIAISITLGVVAGVGGLLSP